MGRVDRTRCGSSCRSGVSGTGGSGSGGGGDGCVPRIQYITGYRASTDSP